MTMQDMSKIRSARGGQAKCGIDQERIERIKTTVDIKALIESKGIRLKKNGKGWFGLCPFHHDKNPSLSVTPSKNQ